ncbi:PAS/PAC sensor hybrid histidine kinase [Desulfamplus magnetovallimortis]|uniref:histidine kinase n=1 Tax=Desulfamplus magnetovallimortis TaxID=1246637 RepID=A0A1W1H5Y4_9BACT|nr:PAS domain-containing sensor histidine kinase [Desulfamplus magnetovallimortis]SLM27889.1 PAS/PAC sensor hybrid histidine kinase [Desulfamplus magnetovallimortis]
MPEKLTYEKLEQKVTELEMAENALKESEERFRLLFDSSADAHVIYKNDSFIDCNWSSIRLLGFEKKSQLLKLHPRDISPPYQPDGHPSREKAESMIALAFEKGSHRFEWLCKRCDGSDVLLDVLLSEIKIKGEPLLHGVWRDITQQKRAGDELRQSELKYRLLFENMAQGAFYQSCDGTLIDVNSTALKMFGLTRDQFLGRTSVDFRWKVINENGSELQGEFHPSMVALRTGQPVLNKIVGVYNPLKEGYVWLSINAIPQFMGEDKQLHQVFVTMHDITEDRKIRALLRKNQERYQKAQRIGKVGNWEYNVQTMEFWGSEEAKNIYGFQPDADTFTTDEVENCIPERERVHKALIDLVESGKEYNLEFDIITKNTNERKTIISIAELEKDGDGNPLKISGVIQDITKRKRSEEALLKLKIQLQQAQKMESIGRLAGGVAHDFNNMLSVILGNTELILDDAGSDSPFFDNLKEIQYAAKRSTDFVRQLLAFARQQTIAPEIINLNSTLEGMLNMLNRLIGEDIELVWAPSERLWPIKIDPSQIDQIFVNLCVNARDAIKGVGCVTIETENIRIDYEYCRENVSFKPGEYVRVCFSDNGCGMGKKILENLFEPFYTTKEVGHGSGLGLATVYGIVKQNNGFINVYSELGEGTTFKIYLPHHVVEAVERSKKESSVTEAVKRHGTILLVEDETAILKMTKMMLERSGYNVLGASTPGEAIRIVQDGSLHKIDLLLTDVVMPEMNGKELAGALIKLYPELKCLFMSGYTANVIAHRGILDEGVHFINKPFSKQELAVKIRDILDEP